VEIGSKRILLNDSITFDTGKDTIKSESFALLDQVVKLLTDHPEMKHVRVEGHTDNVGGAAYNKDLSARRAASVARYLIGKGVAQSRLVPVGYGFEQPIASNATALGRAKNRRVVFTILDEAP
jgi:outer membrane protein OmpA-like peptidoglycan-associated protein